MGKFKKIGAAALLAGTVLAGPLTACEKKVVMPADNAPIVDNTSEVKLTEMLNQDLSNIKTYITNFEHTNETDRVVFEILVNRADLTINELFAKGELDLTEYNSKSALLAERQKQFALLNINDAIECLSANEAVLGILSKSSTSYQEQYDYSFGISTQSNQAYLCSEDRLYNYIDNKVEYDWNYGLKNNAGIGFKGESSLESKIRSAVVNDIESSSQIEYDKDTKSYIILGKNGKNPYESQYTINKDTFAGYSSEEIYEDYTYSQTVNFSAASQQEFLDNVAPQQNKVEQLMQEREATRQEFLEK